MTNEPIVSLEDIQIYSEKILDVLNSLCEKYGANESNTPTPEAFSSKVFGENVPKSYKNSFDFVAGYNQIMTFIDIALDYTHLIFKATSI